MPKWKPLTDAELDAQIEEARLRSAQREKSVPRAISARFDAQTQRLIIELQSGAAVILPCSFISELKDASPEAIAKAEVSPSGEGLHWDELDVHVSVPGLMLELVGMQAINAAVASRAGMASSDMKARAARENGKKGGRPRKAV